MLRLILRITLSAAAALALPALGQGTQPREQSLRRAAALLDYVAGDYSHAVGPDGAVLSPDEFREQQGFLADAAREVRDDAGKDGEDLARRIDELGRAAAGRASPARVSPQARALREELVQRFHVAMVPSRPPDLARGAELYAQACAACHGADGHPPAGLELSTKPPAFAAPDEVRALAPQRIFSAITYGVPSTAMPAYDEALDDGARWDLAFYSLSLARPAPPKGAVELARAALVPTGFRELSALSDEELGRRLAAAGLKDADREAALAGLRAGPFADEQNAGAAGLSQVRRDLSAALAQARAGDRTGARRAVISAYLDHFEPHEPGLRARDAALVADIEREFLAVRAGLEAPRGELAPAEQAAARLDALLERADTKGPYGQLLAFIAALAIALREGVEASLLVAALLALLRKGGRDSDAAAVHAGWVVALFAGGFTWWLSGALLQVSGARRELVEGLLQLVTAALLLYASHWLLAAASAKKLIGFLSQKTSQLAAGSALVVFGLTFAAIYREMFEVVLFFRGLLLEAPGAGSAIALGAVVGVLLLMLLVAAFQRVGKRLKPRPLLLACGLLLCLLAVLMVGNGVRALQEAGLVPLTVWGGFQVPALGVYATREGILAQALVLLLLVGSAIFTLVRRGDSPGGAARAAA